MWLYRSLFLVVTIVLAAACAHKPLSEAVRLPENETAFIAGFHWKGYIFNVRRFFVDYIDGERLFDHKEDSSVFGGFRLLPGKHTIGITVQHGNFCFPGPFGDACINSCFSGISLMMDAGRRYSYEIEKDQSNVFVNVIDDGGKVVSKSLCEPCSFGVCGEEQRKTIMERLESNAK